MKLYSPAGIAELSKKHNFKFSKSLGQNFLCDGNIVSKIIEGADIGNEDLVIEIGPGMGVLTAAVAPVSARIIAIEKDRNLMPILEETLDPFENVTLINADIMEIDIAKLIRSFSDRELFKGGVKIIGNLPYYITTPIIVKILESNIGVDNMTVMMQKEVADRIKAAPGTKAYGSLSLIVGYFCRPRHVIDVSREVFIPRPNVNSSVLRLDVIKEKPIQVKDEQMLFAVIKAGFAKRRKTVANSMTGLMGFNKDEIKEVLAQAKIDPVRRGETMTLEEFAAVTDVISRKRHL